MLKRKVGDNCRDCKRFEEKIYWTHFQSVQFSQILSGHYENQLEVPKKFAKNLGGKLGREVVLKVPSGATWNVELENESDSLYFRQGWKEFVDDNSLGENDLMIFKYNGSSGFDVLLFDQQSSCEKEASYFVRKCGHPVTPRVYRRRGNEIVRETSERVLHGSRTPPNDVLEPDGENLQVESTTADDGAGESSPSERSRKDGPVTPNSAENHTANGQYQKRKRSSAPEVRARTFEFISNRRPVTEVEKADAEQKAITESSHDSLAIAMKEYNVYRRFFLTVPSWWSNEHLPRRHSLVKLQVKGKSWLVKFDKRSTGGMLTAGWKKFAVDNVLEECDVCLFNLVNGRSDPVVIDVSIFRVVEEVIRPTPARPRSSSRRGRKPPQLCSKSEFC